jgi:hypothetical protein
MVDSCLRQIDFLDGELAVEDRQIASQALDSPQMRRLLTLPRSECGHGLHVGGHHR